MVSRAASPMSSNNTRLKSWAQESVGVGFKLTGFPRRFRPLGALLECVGLFAALRGAYLLW